MPGKIWKRIFIHSSFSYSSFTTNGESRSDARVSGCYNEWRKVLNIKTDVNLKEWILNYVDSFCKFETT